MSLFTWFGGRHDIPSSEGDANEADGERSKEGGDIKNTELRPSGRDRILIIRTLAQVGANPTLGFLMPHANEIIALLAWVRILSRARSPGCVATAHGDDGETPECGGVCGKAGVGHVISLSPAWE